VRSSRPPTRARTRPHLVVTASGISRSLDRLAAAVRARNRSALAEGSLVLVGVKRRGVPLARRLARLVSAGPVPVGAVDITLYRDDLQMIAETPIVRGTEIGFDINGRTVVLVDDVIFTGRTTRAALTELLDFGRPRAIQLAVLVDRGFRELPVQPDFTGRVLKTARTDLVDICLNETDGREGVYLTRR
jgi:pyrimidine operon attenuation protein/uracil phosphoribosyltransferase